MRGPEPWMEWLSPDHLLGRLVIASIELTLLALLLALVVRVMRGPSGRVLACAWCIVLLKPLATLALGTPIPLLRFQDTTHPQRITLPETRTSVVANANANADAQAATALAPEASVLPAENDSASRPTAGDVARGDVAAAVDADGDRELDLRSLVLGAWALGVGVLGVRWIRSHHALRRLVRAGEPLPVELEREWSALARTCAPARRVDVRVTRDLESPSLVGLVRTTVLVPAWLLERGRRDSIAWALKHELAHARWLDPLAIAVRDLVSVLFFFHPLVPWIRRRHADAMESACDWEAVNDPADAASYAESLGAILSSIHVRRRGASPAEALAMVAHGSTARRVEALLEGRAPRRMTASAASLLLLVAGLVLAVGCGASREKPSSDDVSAVDPATLEKLRALGYVVEPPAKDREKPARSGAAVTVSNAPPGAPTSGDPTRRIRVERAVTDGLLWLARHQDADGAWRPTSLTGTCADAGEFFAPKQPYTKNFDSGITALALRCFLDAGYTPSTTDEWTDPTTSRRVRPADVVQKAIERLVADMKAEGGSTPGRPFMYNESLVATALSKASTCARDPRVKEAAQRAVTFVQAAQRPSPTGNGLWGWRYAARHEVENLQRPVQDPNVRLRELCDSDTSITGWCAETLAVAAAAGLDVKRENLDGALAFTKYVSADDGGVGYIDPRGAGAKVTGPYDHYVYHAASMSALGVLTRLDAGGRRDDPFLRLAAAKIVADAPRVTDDKLSVDYYYWRFGLRALAALDGPRAPERTGAAWDAWSASAAEALLSLQDHQPQPCTNGGWVTRDRWSYAAGPMYATSMNVLTLVEYLHASTP